jgi:hypothetical protein
MLSVLQIQYHNFFITLGRRKMKNQKILVLIIILGISLSCASAKISDATGLLPESFKIAISPRSGALADAIGIELFKRGYLIVDSKQLASLLAQIKLNENDVSKPQNLSLLKKNGIDAIVNVKATIRSNGFPKSASVSINDTTSWEKLAGVNWKTGWGGMPGSPMDRSMRADMGEAATQIVDA